MSDIKTTYLNKNPHNWKAINSDTSIKTIPCESTYLDNFLPYFGNIEVNILIPSKGGSGSRLKNPSERFIKTPTSRSVVSGLPENPFETRMLWAKANIIAKIKFVTTPAAETTTSPSFGLLKLYGLYGTGFAQPIIAPPKLTTDIMGNSIEPTMSICGTGFIVSLPAFFAVLSPK